MNHEDNKREPITDSQIISQEETAAAWLEFMESQPEPTSDCSSDEDHYMALDTLGLCPYCGQQAR